MKQLIWTAGLAMLILLITLFNFFNLRYIILLKTLKTIRIMRIIGAYTRHIFKYQFIESFMYSVFAIIAAFILVYFLYPHFNLLMNKPSDAGIVDRVPNTILILCSLVILFSLTGLLPYLIVKISSAFMFLRTRNLETSGNGVRGLTGRFRLLKTLLGVQYIMTFILLSCLFGEIRQLNLFMQHRLGKDSGGITQIRINTDLHRILIN